MSEEDEKPPKQNYNGGIDEEDDEDNDSDESRKPKARSRSSARRSSIPAVSMSGTGKKGGAMPVIEDCEKFTESAEDEEEDDGIGSIGR